jgi:DNA ligase-1
MLLRDLVTTSAAVGEASGRLAKIGLLADLLRRLAPEEIEIAIGFLSGEPRQGRMGIGYSTISASKDVTAAETPELHLHDVDEAFTQLAAIKGSGSAAARHQRLRDLLTRAIRAEQDFIIRLLFGELRQGALEGVLVEAVAKASGIAAPTVRRAAMMAGALAPVARAALVNGETGLSSFGVQLFQPVQPMLAQPAADMTDALDQLQRDVSLEWNRRRRIQVHKSGDEVRVFSRNLRDVTAAVPEVVEAMRSLDVRDLIMDGEVIALRPDASPHPFQVTMQRFGRKLDVERLRAEVPLTPFLFDCLYADGESLIDIAQEVRAARLDAVAPWFVVPRLVRPTHEAAARFLEETLNRGHEGLMVKALAAALPRPAWPAVAQDQDRAHARPHPRRGVGPRTTNWMARNLHLGARDPVHGGFVMLGKTFKGLTDEMLVANREAARARDLTRSIQGT